MKLITRRPRKFLSDWRLPAPRYEVGYDDSVAHIYYAVKDGRRRILPGVTGTLDIIAKPALINWAKKVALESAKAAIVKRLDGLPEKELLVSEDWVDEIIKEAKRKPDEIKDQAANVGTRAHALFERVFKGDLPDEVDDDLATPIDNFLDWLDSTGLEIVAGDTKVASLEHGYGGSLDGICRCPMLGTLVLIDYKTSNGIWPTHALQVAAYQHALNETYGVYCDEAHIVRFDKIKHKFERKQLRNIGMSMSAFLCAKDLKALMAEEQYGIG